MLTQSRDLEMQDASSNTTDSHVEAQLQLLKPDPEQVKKEPGSGSTRTRSRTTSRRLQPAPPAAPSPYGYNATATPPSNPVDLELNIHPELRARPNAAPEANMLPATVAPPAPPTVAVAGPSNTMANPQIPGPVGGDEPTMDGRKAKRELSQSKRAAQNRAAQRAFRQRKEGYIKKLEQQVKDFEGMESNIKDMQMENYSLREYVIHLQTRLLEALGECPPPPPNLDLSRPTPQGPGPSTTVASHPAPTHPTTASGLEAVAQAVAGLQEARFAANSDAKSDDARTAEELKQQLNG